jgi:hypothetical protein
MGLAMDGFQGGRERTLPRFGIFRKKNVAIFKKNQFANGLLVAGTLHLAPKIIGPLWWDSGQSMEQHRLLVSAIPIWRGLAD